MALISNATGVIGAQRYYPFTQKYAAPQGFFTLVVFAASDFMIHIASTNARNYGSGYVLNTGGGLGYKFVYHRLGVEGFVGWAQGY